MQPTGEYKFFGGLLSFPSNLIHINDTVFLKMVHCFQVLASIFKQSSPFHRKTVAFP